MYPAKEVSNAELGRLRPPSVGDIERRIAASQRSPAERATHQRTMQRLERAATQFVQAKQHGLERPTPPPKTAERSMATGGERHNSVAQGRYAEPKQNPPAHVAMRRSIDAHIQRNVQREARSERIRTVGQQVKQKVLTVAQEIGRTALGRSATQTQKAPPARQHTMQTERGDRQPQQTLLAQRDRVQTRQVEQASRQQTARQQQQNRGKEQERGRSR